MSEHRHKYKLGYRADVDGIFALCTITASCDCGETLGGAEIERRLNAGEALDVKAALYLASVADVSGAPEATKALVDYASILEGSRDETE